MLNSRWFLEVSTSQEMNLHTIEEILYKDHSPYQSVEILRLGSFGKALILDGKMQSSEFDEFIYHESLIHPAMVVSDGPKKVLIAGGGEGASIREVLKYESVDEVYLVDLDKFVVDACIEYLPEWHKGAFDSPKVKLVFDDAREFIKKSDQLFDLIFLDLPEPFEDGPAHKLYTREFYSEVYDHLTENGCMVTQATSIAANNYAAYTIILNSIRDVFPLVKGYWSAVPSFYVPWGFVFASKGIDPVAMDSEELEGRVNQISDELRFYDSEMHYALFSLPKFLKTAVNNEQRVNSDTKPISFY